MSLQTKLTTQGSIHFIFLRQKKAIYLYKINIHVQSNLCPRFKKISSSVIRVFFKGMYNNVNLHIFIGKQNKIVDQKQEK